MGTKTSGVRRQRSERHYPHFEQNEYNTFVLFCQSLPSFPSEAAMRSRMEALTKLRLGRTRVRAYVRARAGDLP